MIVSPLSCRGDAEGSETGQALWNPLGVQFPAERTICRSTSERDRPSNRPGRTRQEKRKKQKTDESDGSMDRCSQSEGAGRQTGDSQREIDRAVQKQDRSDM